MINGFPLTLRAYAAGRDRLLQPDIWARFSAELVSSRVGTAARLRIRRQPGECK